MNKYAALATLMLALTSCSGEVSIGGSSVSQADLEEQVAAQLTPQDQATVEATCQGDLAAEVGATQECSVTVGDHDVAVLVTATSVEGSDVVFDLVPTLAQADLEAAVAGGYTADQEITAVCDGDLVGAEGEQQRCEVTVGPDTVPVELSVTGLDGADIGFSAVPVLTGASVAEAVTNLLAGQGTTPDDLVCTEDLRGEVGTRITCTLTLNGTEAPLQVIVTQVDGLMVNFKIKG